jgi:hypothetical protein
MVNIIFDKVPLGSFTYKTFNLIKERNEITWKILFDFLEKKTGIPCEYLKLRYRNNIFTIQSNLFNYNDFVNSTEIKGGYITFGVDYNFDKIRAEYSFASWIGSNHN